MEIILFPLLLTNPPLQIPIYNHDLKCLEKFKQLQGQCKFADMTVTKPDIFSYGVVGVKDGNVHTSAVLLLPKNGVHFEIYSLCTSFLSRKKGYASELLVSVLNNLQQFYKYVWIGIDSTLNEITFKQLIKLYSQLGFIYYTSFNTKTPLGIEYSNGFVQLIKEYTSKPTVFSSFYNKDLIELAWNCAHTKTTPIVTCINPNLIHDIFKKYGKLNYEVGGTFFYTSKPPSPTDKYNPLHIEYRTLTSTEKISQGTEEELAVYPPTGVYNFHTHPIIGTNMFKTTFAWPSMADVFFTLKNTFYTDLLLHIVVACDGFYTMNVTSDTLIDLRYLSDSEIQNVFNKINSYLNQVGFEKQRSVYQRYFQNIGWTTQLVSDGTVKGLKHIFISPSGVQYPDLAAAVQSDEYKNLNLSPSFFSNFIMKDAQSQIKYLMDVVKNMTLKKFCSSKSDKPIVEIRYIPYSSNKLHPITVYTFKPYDIPILQYKPTIVIEKQKIPIHSKTIQKSKKYQDVKKFKSLLSK